MDVLKITFTSGITSISLVFGRFRFFVLFSVGNSLKYNFLSCFEKKIRNGNFLSSEEIFSTF